MRDPFAEFDSLVRDLEPPRTGAKRGAAKPPPRRGARARARTWLTRVGVLLAAAVLPFYALVGASVLLYRFAGIPTWLALIGGAGMTTLVLLSYALAAAWRVSGVFRLPPIVWRGIGAIVLAYALYTLLYVSSLNIKDVSLQREYRSLHPLLRLATSTFILVDRDVVITDMERISSDYERMGLPVYERSLHLEQRDGFAHAIDLRTLDRSEWRNLLMEAYFRAMGFRTLRHVGTADHLHVSLPLAR